MEFREQISLWGPRLDSAASVVMSQFEQQGIFQNNIGPNLNQTKLALRNMSSFIPTTICNDWKRVISLLRQEIPLRGDVQLLPYLVLAMNETSDDSTSALLLQHCLRHSRVQDTDAKNMMYSLKSFVLQFSRLILS